MEWQPIKTSPKDGTNVLLWAGSGVEVGSFRKDDGCSGNRRKLWLDNSYDDFSCGYASRPLKPSHWMPLPAAPVGAA